MNQVNYEAMSKSELKEYFLKHRGDKLALQTYLDKLNEKPLTIITTADDPDFEKKVQAAITEKLEKGRNQEKNH
ncbi:MAG: DUF6887 family protein [Halothece sp.]